MKKPINLALPIIEVLKKYSSKDRNLYTHPLTCREIFEKIKEDYKTETDAYGITEKMVRTCLKNMIEMESYMDEKNKTICYKSFEDDDSDDNGYKTDYYTPKQISDYELKFLVDSVMYSKIFSSKTAQDFARRVQQLSGKNLKEMTNYTHENTFGQQRHISEIKVLENVQNIMKAINESRYIMINFNNFDVNNEKIVLRNQQKDSVLYPLQLVLNEGRYVLMAHYKEKETVYYFNVDLISNIRLLEKNEHRSHSDNITGNFKHAPYILQHPFLMGGEPELINLRIKRESFSRVVDTFSYEIKIITNTTTKDTVDIQVKSSVKGIVKWLLANYDIAELIGASEELNKELNAAIEELNKKYKK